MIDESNINPNLDQVYSYFDELNKRYFSEIGPIDEFFENVSCYNCGSTQYLTEFTVNRFRHVRCRNCGMVYVNPRLKERIIHDFYGEEEYSAVYKMKLIPSIEYRRNVLSKKKYDQIMGFMQSPGIVLDIGSGLGETLSVFKENGWECTGIELNAFAANYARDQFGLDIINESIFGTKLDGTFDLVMMWGVLEHFYDPMRILRKIHSLLKRDGLFVCEVPSADSVLVRYYEAMEKPVDRIIEGDRHIMLFSRRSFIEMMEKSGFSPIKLQTNGLDIATLNRLELENTMDLNEVNRLQAILDESFQGDLLRGFFRRESI